MLKSSSINNLIVCIIDYRKMTCDIFFINNEIQFR